MEENKENVEELNVDQPVEEQPVMEQPVESTPVEPEPVVESAPVDEPAMTENVPSEEPVMPEAEPVVPSEMADAQESVEVPTTEPSVEETTPVEAESVVESAPATESTIEQPAEQSIGDPVGQATNVEQPVLENPTPENNSGEMEPIVEDKKKNNKMIIAIAAVAVVIALVLLLPSLLFNKKTLVSHEVGVLFKEARTSLDKLDKNSLKYDLDKDVVGVSGTVTFDSDYKTDQIDLTKLKGLKVSYDGVIDKKGNKASGSLKLIGSQNLLDVNAMMNGKIVFVNLGDLYEKTILTQTEKEVKDVEVSSVTAEDMKILLDKTEKTIKENIKDEDITKEKVQKEINGKKGSYQKISYKVNVVEHTKKVIEAYNNDDSVVEVLAKMSGLKEKEVKDSLKKSLDSMKDAKEETITVNAYTSGLVPKANEYEIILDDDTIIVIDVNDKVYDYKIMEGKKVLGTGHYDTNKQEFTYKVDSDGVKVEMTIAAPTDNKVTGKIDFSSGEISMKVDFNLNSKVSAKKADVTGVCNVEVKEGTETMKFSLKAETTAQVGAKVNEFNASNTVKINEMSEQDMNIIYGRLMQKLQPIMSQIMPGMNAANFRQKLTK